MRNRLKILTFKIGDQFCKLVIIEGYAIKSKNKI